MYHTTAAPPSPTNITAQVHKYLNCQNNMAVD